MRKGLDSFLFVFCEELFVIWLYEIIHWNKFYFFQCIFKIRDRIGSKLDIIKFINTRNIMAFKICFSDEPSIHKLQLFVETICHKKWKEKRTPILWIPSNIFQYLYLVLGKLFSRTFFSICSPLINPFHTSGIFLCPLKRSESFSRKEISSNKQKSLNLTASFYPSGKNGFVKR